jgi:hypothetical protein
VVPFIWSVSVLTGWIFVKLPFEKSGCWSCASVHMERFGSYWVDFREITVREKRLFVMWFRSYGTFRFLLGGFS